MSTNLILDWVLFSWFSKWTCNHQWAVVEDSRGNVAYRQCTKCGARR